MGLITNDNDGNIVFKGPGFVTSSAVGHAAVVAGGECPEKFGLVRVCFPEFGLKARIELVIKGFAVGCFAGGNKEANSGGRCGFLDVLSLAP